MKLEGILFQSDKVKQKTSDVNTTAPIGEFPQDCRSASTYVPWMTSVVLKLVLKVVLDKEYFKLHVNAATIGRFGLNIYKLKTFCGDYIFWISSRGFPSISVQAL